MDRLGSASSGVPFVKHSGRISGRIMILDQDNLIILILMDISVWGKEFEMYFECESEPDIPPSDPEIDDQKIASASS